MGSDAHLFKQLDQEWRATARGRQASAAAGQWARGHAVLAGLATPADVVELCQRRGDPERSAQVLRAVLAEVGNGSWPARTVLQAVLPGLATVVRRAMPLVGGHGPWQRPDELDQHVVALAHERITVLAAAPPPWPAAAIVDGTWQRLRTAVQAEARRTARQCLLEEGTDHAVDDPTNPADDVADVLAGAVDRGILDHLDCWLIYASRIEDRSMEVLGPQFGHSSRWGWRRRRRAEQVLRGARVLVAPGP